MGACGKLCAYRHSHPGAFLPFHPKTDECDVKYIVIMRNPGTRERLCGVYERGSVICIDSMDKLDQEEK